MTHPPRTITATLLIALMLSSFSYGLTGAYADGAGTATSTSTGSTVSSSTSSTGSSTPSVSDSSVASSSASTASSTAASTTPDTPGQPVTPVASSTSSSSTPNLPFNPLSAILTGSSTASSSVSSGDAASTTTSTSTVPMMSTTTTATSTGPTIQSGEAVALANILNILNMNLVNSSGNALLLNYVTPVTGPIDLRTGTPVFASSSPICALIACAGTGGVSVNLSNGADIKNAVVLSATSGGNLIDMGSTTGNALITTGNAYAGLNLINLANTNIIDSNYLLVTMNAFQGVHGDIIFPSLTNFFSSLVHSLSPGSISTSDNANVTNKVSADAQTGGNSAEASSSVITTGSATSRGSVFNQINTNGLGGSNIAILFRVQGAWAGKVFGAPQGLQWAQGPGGTIALFNADPNSGSGNTALAQLTSSSTAKINNDVSVIALTGQNQIKNAQAALITTGNALASANVINIANTNVVGKNWIMAIINIFGDFNGNISFGQPDLWVGEQVTVPSYVGNGSQAAYKFTVINNGDAPATNVQLTDTYDQNHIQVTSASASYTTNANGEHVWNLGTIPPRGAVEVTYQGTVQNTSPGTSVTDTVKVSEDETDHNPADNIDTATFTASVPSGGGGSYYFGNLDSSAGTAVASSTARLTVSRANPSSTSQNGAPVHQEVTVINTSNSASIPVVVHDILTAPDGTQVYDEHWDIGSLSAGDAVQLAYDANFSAGAPSGTYMLSTVIYDEKGTELGRFADNGTVAVTNTHRLLPPLGAYATVHHATNGGNNPSTLAGFPDVNVAHAAGAANQAAAAGLVSLSWPYLLAILLVILGLLALMAWYRRREQQ